MLVSGENGKGGGWGVGGLEHMPAGGRVDIFDHWVVRVGSEGFNGRKAVFRRLGGEARGP